MAKKKMPVLRTDEEAEAFLERDDLSDYLHAGNFSPVRFIFTPEVNVKDGARAAPSKQPAAKKRR
jgi:hypothetical protein